MMLATPTLDAIRGFREAQPYDQAASTASRRRAYFLESARVRYVEQPHILSGGQFRQTWSRRVLEIECRLRIDAVQSAREAARYVGVDRTVAVVVHHTVDPVAVVSEIHRVLNPGRTVTAWRVISATKRAPETGRNGSPP